VLGKKLMQMQGGIEMSVRRVLYGIARQAETRTYGSRILCALVFGGPVGVAAVADVVLESAPNLERAREHTFNACALNGVGGVEC